MDSVHKIQTRTWTGIRIPIFIDGKRENMSFLIYNYNIFIQKPIARVFQDWFNKLMMRHSLTTGVQKLDININYCHNSNTITSFDFTKIST